MSMNKMNPDLASERQNATIDVEKMKSYIGEFIYQSEDNYKKMLHYREKMVKKIKPIFEENFYNLERDGKYQMILKKSLELIDFILEEKLEDTVDMYMLGAVLGPEKITFNLHFTMFKDAIEVWGTPEQYKYFQNILNNNVVFGTYVQTELGHGTYLRGLETTATYDKKTEEFVIDSPTTTSIKFWPGASGKTCNYAIVMAKLIIDGLDHGIHAFVVQLRSLENHKVVPGLEIGDIGRKFGFDATDNGFLKFNKLRIPRNHMLMQFARVTPEGKFERIGNELLMYAAMLLMRGTLSMYGSFFLSISTTIAIRYSCVRRQTVNAEGIEQQVINYQTQQYRLFSALATTYAASFAGWTFRRILLKIHKESNNFKNVSSKDLAQLHAVSSGLKSVVFSDCLKFAQSNRLCCGGHGYSSASGLGQIIQEADAACTYEGDNVVLLLQTARYLLKCAQKNNSPHLEMESFEKLKTTDLYKYFEKYFDIYHRLFQESMNEITAKLFDLVTEKKLPELSAWNQTSVQLINAARIFTDLFIINSNLLCISMNKVKANQQALNELFELYLLYGITDVYATNILKLNVIDSILFNQFKEKLYELLPKIRKNAVALVDSFNMLDSNLCSALGAYDGDVYQRLYDFAKKSQFNDKDVHDSYKNHLKPYIDKHKKMSKL